MINPKWMGGNSQEWISIADVISVDTTSPAVVDTKSISLQLGNASTGESYGTTAQLFNPFGIYSIPLPSVLGKPGTQVLSWVRNDESYSFAGRDINTQKNPGNIKPGETAVYATGSQAKALFKNDGSINLLTTSDNTESGYTVGQTITGSKITLQTAKCSLTLDDNVGITLTVGTAALTLTFEGIATLMGQVANVQGSLANISGSVATFVGQGCPATCIGSAAQPVPTTNALYGVGGPVTAPSPSVYLSLV
jgi:hypothetical protein